MPHFTEASDIGFTSGAKVGAFKGAVKNLTNIEYHSLHHYWSSTNLKDMYSGCPAHFKEKYFELRHSAIPDKEPELIRKPKDESRPSNEMILGSLVHCLTLTPHYFDEEFFVMPELNLRTNDGKEKKEK